MEIYKILRVVSFLFFRFTKVYSNTTTKLDLCSMGDNTNEVNNILSVFSKIVSLVLCEKSVIGSKAFSAVFLESNKLRYELSIYLSSKMYDKFINKENYDVLKCFLESKQFEEYFFSPEPESRGKKICLSFFNCFTTFLKEEVAELLDKKGFKVDNFVFLKNLSEKKGFKKIKAFIKPKLEILNDIKIISNYIKENTEAFKEIDEDYGTISMSDSEYIYNFFKHVFLFEDLEKLEECIDFLEGINDESVDETDNIEFIDIICTNFFENDFDSEGKIRISMFKTIREFFNTVLLDKLSDDSPKFIGKEFFKRYLNDFRNLDFNILFVEFLKENPDFSTELIRDFMISVNNNYSLLNIVTEYFCCTKSDEETIEDFLKTIDIEKICKDNNKSIFELETDNFVFVQPFMKIFLEHFKQRLYSNELLSISTQQNETNLEDKTLKNNPNKQIDNNNTEEIKPEKDNKDEKTLQNKETCDVDSVIISEKNGQKQKGCRGLKFYFLIFIGMLFAVMTIVVTIFYKKELKKFYNENDTIDEH